MNKKTNKELAMDIKDQIEIIKRGAVDLISEAELEAKLKKAQLEERPLRVKLGLDPTAPDLHLGHTVVLQKLKQFQELGHTAIFLIGDFTGMIGDPTGRIETRPALTREELLKNAETYKEQVFKILDMEKTEVRFNSEWMESMNAADMIRLCAQYTMARIMEREDFKNRYMNNLPISIHEFLYPLVQGYDSVALKADVELGGHDQIFNLFVGRDLQKVYGQEPQVIVTVPLLEGTDGINKMSKSYGNYVGIDESPDVIFGKLMSISDDLMLKYYELLSDISVDEYRKLKDDIINGTVHPRDAKVNFAKEIVRRFHGIKDAEEAHDNFDKVFRNKEIPDDIDVLKIERKEIEKWMPKLLVNLGMVSSTTEGKRMIAQGGVSVNGEKMTNEHTPIENVDEFIVKVGKRKFKKIILI
ncbi:MAG TPA: tyrosine--tRNA ligase [Syntrophorhabdaceae bacterium]|jgi:tyrosyl-tRNA synthetase|nr:tyrosine--tRNA ligase [Syntrophorhabdaceae bacterium]HNZ59234.1 tyrosine--tRNA ligase [Syntrophorhabdaceae bacterium]HOB69575.1 tyrosine--tRNA ligase [Syntrophorhabdaceae bacterium]HOG40335.1 tyrosine--tRNA ligase [Syntrophorhabdaceae bacterium]HPH42422.1 tyrosine--tRNA ligase [Syntrophorhabdaceae bacterium]